MLRKFAAALLATALIAGPALAAPPAGSAGSPATVSTSVNKPAVKHAKMVKHFRRHIVRHKVGKIKMARHFKYRHHIAAPVVKHLKVNKTSRVNKTNKSTHS
jgi:hypothetical protein